MKAAVIDSLERGPRFADFAEPVVTGGETLVEVMAGPTISLPADVLRSSGLEILGSGPGTIPLAEITGAIPEFMSLAATSDLPIDIDEVPLAEVEPTRHRRSGGRRIVFRS